MSRVLLCLFVIPWLGACGATFVSDAPDEVSPQAETAEADAASGVLDAAPPPPEARTAEALDTTSIEQRAEAAAAPAAETRELGKTVVSLGSPTEPGFWLKTPLVQTEAQGRVTNPANGKSSAVRLIPIEGEATAGSRLSLAAMRLIELPLTDLGEVEVSLEADASEASSG